MTSASPASTAVLSAPAAADDDACDESVRCVDITKPLR